MAIVAGMEGRKEKTGKIKDCEIEVITSHQGIVFPWT